MQNELRRLRLDRGMTLAEVAARARPRTTAQTVGRLETGNRTLSVPWLMRLAPALGVDPAALVGGAPLNTELPVVAVLNEDRVQPVARARSTRAPMPSGDMVALDIAQSVGDYRAGDRVWCRRVEPDRFASALNRDVLVARGGGRFSFGRLIAIDDGRLQLVPLRAGARQAVVNRPEWIAPVVTLIREYA